MSCKTDKAGVPQLLLYQIGAICPAGKDRWHHHILGREEHPVNGKMDGCDSSLHIVSAQICELWITFGQKNVNGKGNSNEIPAVQELIKQLENNGSMLLLMALTICSS